MTMGSEVQAVDAVVVGGGPAGLAAATWLARYRCRVVVVDSDEHRNRWVERAHGYLGSDPIDPAALRDRARADLARYEEAELVLGKVTSVGPPGGDPRTFPVAIEGQPPLRAKRIVLATGVSDRFPEVGGFFEHYGASVFHCPTCDGYEARGCDVVAFGWSEHLTGFAATLDGWARSVTIVTDDRRFEGDERHRAILAERGIRIVEEDAVELLGVRGDLRGVRLRSGDVLECQLVFFSIAHDVNNGLAAALGCATTPEGCVAVDEHAATSVPGVYAAGDVTPGLQLVQVAAAKGAIAGVACAQSLRGEGGTPPWWGRALDG